MSKTSSKNTTTSATPKTAVPDKVSLRVQEGFLILFMAVFLYLMMALVSYHPDDPSWSDTGSNSEVTNAAGPVGAWLADIFFSLFGYMAFLFPLMLAYRAWRLFRERATRREFEWVVVGLRVMGLVLVMIAATGLAAIGDSGLNDMPVGSGGVLGRATAEAGVEAFSVLGSRLILVSIFLFGLTIFVDISWLRLMDKIGAKTIALAKKSRIAFEEYREKRAAKKELAAQQKQRQDAIQKEIKQKEVRIAPKIAPPPKKIEKSKRAEAERQQVMFDAPVSGSLPSLGLLDAAKPEHKKGFSKEALEAMSRLLEIKLLDFNVIAKVVAVYPGPVITRFEIEPDAGVKVSKITNLAKDIARSLAVVSVRVVEVIPGKPYIGIEIPNEDREIVNFQEVLSSESFDSAKSALTLALGHDIGGEPVVADLAKMPHLLVAGTTGSGKSVGVNAMLLSLLYKAGPDKVRLLLIDPKMLELSVYEGIPHLLAPVVTDMKEAASGLRWCVAEMERRYKLMASAGVRNLAGFNRKVEDAIAAGEPMKDPFWVAEEEYNAGEEVATAPDLEPLPFIVVVIDEFADMMMIVGKKVEELIARIAQKARAAGIHLILATQRPSVDVITGLIKANVPTRIAFQVSSKIDSRTILDQGGAEQLLGHGDMLFLPPGSGMPIRVHGAFCSDEEVHRVASDWKARGQPNYIEGVLEDGGGADAAIPGMSMDGEGGDDPEADALYDEAVYFVCQSRRASISSVQRKLRIGYNRAARLIEAMEMAGIVTEMGHNGSREVLAPPPVE